MKGIILALIAILIIIAFISFSTLEVGPIQMNVAAGGFADVSASEAKRLIDTMPGIIVIDVSPNYDDGHIPGALNYYPQSALDAAIPSLDKDATYLVYCHTDGPSRSGAQKLVDAGIEKVYRLESHYGGWVAAGYPVES